MHFSAGQIQVNGKKQSGNDKIRTHKQVATSSTKYRELVSCR